jgi:hypothetical protein
MMTLKEKPNMKNILKYCAVILTLLTLAACGGGGGGGGDTQTPAKTSASLTINLTGALPASTGISGTTFTLTLPANVTPKTTNDVVDSGVVALSGTFAGGTQTPPVYTAATATAPGTISVTLANSVTDGVMQAGEVAKITLQLANGAAPTAASFGVSGVSVVDASQYNTISGMAVSVASVTLQ